MHPNMHLLAAQSVQQSREACATYTNAPQSTKPQTGTSVRTANETTPCQLQSPFNVIAMGWSDGRPVVRSPEQLRLHGALAELGLTGIIQDLNDSSLLKDQSMPEPILVTTSGTILAGFGRWRSALFDIRHEIHCIEYALSDDQALKFILRHHQSRRGWNAFIRIRLALKLESHFQQKALDNMRAGGKYKGSANLPEAHCIDVRQEVAHIAGVGSRNVSNVKTILQTADARLIDALADGRLSIHRAIQWCRLPKAKQLEHFIRFTWERTRNKVIRQAIAQPKTDTISPDLTTLLDAMRCQDTRQPGSVVLRVSQLRRTIVLIGQDLLTDLRSQEGTAPV
jgi:hypothetical protein